uniref:Uncharacterized protein n=1 Tax=Arundo donax TaxID=35708 RepID=A0A0A9HSR3_ARUDO
MLKMLLLISFYNSHISVWVMSIERYLFRPYSFAFENCQPVF